MQLVIVTGMSGSGKSTAMRVLEDIGYYCIDNLPPILIDKFIELCKQSGGNLEKVAIALDIRAGDMFSKIHHTLRELRSEMPEHLKVIFMETSDDVLLKRYKETRRRHPLFDTCNSLEEAIQAERQRLQPLRSLVDYYIETSHLSTAQLGVEVRNLFLENENDSMLVKVMSFGYKYGISTESDVVFDVRCLPNPFYIPELKQHTGCESCVRDYVMQFEQSQQLLQKNHGFDGISPSPLHCRGQKSISSCIWLYRRKTSECNICGAGGGCLERKGLSCPQASP